MKFRTLLTCAAFIVSGTADDPTKNDGMQYAEPQVDGLHWSDTFDGDVLSRWTISEKEKYSGKPEVAKRRVEGLIGDEGLLMPEGAKHYGISTSFPVLSSGRKGETFYLQFEARFQDGLQCGGGYVKLFNRADQAPKDFDDETPYVIMFGPDRCGSTDKVHFILKHRNPKTGSWEEKHFKEPPSAPRDEKTHLYGLLIKPDNTFEIQLDGTSKASGNLLSSMEPPINPPKEIDDPHDSKPNDWVDDPKMADPESKKPDEWDEDEPRMIDDASASMPSGWLEDAEKRIEDPNAQKPADWDEDEDGDWEAPTIDNPACKVGCGKWTPPKISNPKYKGKWSPEMIENPDYKGVWKPRQIENPDYFVDEEPHALAAIDSIGIDIWTMQGGILYDNFVISTDEAKVTEFTAQSFDLRRAIEDKQNPGQGLGFFAGIVNSITDNPVPAGVTLLVVLVATFFLCCRGSSAPPPPPGPKSAPSKSTNGAVSSKQSDVQDKDTDEGEAKAAPADKKETREEPAGGVDLDDKKDDS